MQMLHHKFKLTAQQKTSKQLLLMTEFQITPDNSNTQTHKRMINKWWNLPSNSNMHCITVVGSLQ